MVLTSIETFRSYSPNFSSAKILQLTKNLVKKSDLKIDDNPIDEKACLRFICNACTGNSDICRVIWPHLLEKNIFETFLENINVRFEILVLLYNVCQAFRAN